MGMNKRLFFRWGKQEDWVEFYFIKDVEQVFELRTHQKQQLLVIKEGEEWKYKYYGVEK